MNKEQIVTAVIGKAISDKLVKEACQNFADGDTFDGRLNLTIDFKGHKEASSTMNASCSILSLPVLAAIFRRAGLQRDNLVQLIEDAAAEVYLGKEFQDAIKTQDAELVDWVEQIQKRISAKLPRTPKSGSVKVQAEIVVAGTVNGEPLEDYDVQTKPAKKGKVVAEPVHREAPAQDEGVPEPAR